MKRLITYCLILIASTLVMAQPASWQVHRTGDSAFVNFQTRTFMNIDGINTAPQISDAIGIFTSVYGTERCVGYTTIRDTSLFKIAVFSETNTDTVGYSPGSIFSIRWWKKNENCEVVFKPTSGTLDTVDISISEVVTTLPSVNYAKTTFTNYDTNPIPTIFAAPSDLIFSATNGLLIDSTKGEIYIQSAKPNTYTISLTSKTCLKSNSIVVIKKDSIIAPVIIAPDLSKLSYSTLSPGCKTLGSIYFKDNTISGSHPFDFWLTNTYTGEHIQNKTGQFDDLREGVYHLRVIDSAGIESVFNKSIALVKTEECNSAILAPNAKDGLQAIFIPEVGNAKILDRDGNTIKQLSIPAEWDGRDSKGSNVPMGDYYLFINEEQAKVITVIR